MEQQRFLGQSWNLTLIPQNTKVDKHLRLVLVDKIRLKNNSYASIQPSRLRQNDEESLLGCLIPFLYKFFNNHLNKMGQACQNPQTDTVPGLPAPKAAVQLCQTASVEQKSQPESPFAHLPPAVSAKIRELNYCPQQLQAISAYPAIQLSNGLTYQGPFENNLMNGVCRLAMPDGSYFQGRMERNRLNGEGVLIDPRGEYYRGGFKDNKAEGKGVYVGDDFTYEGEFKKNLYYGHGKLAKPNEVFEGLFQKGKMKRGKLTRLAQESTYQGQFQGNIENGLGKLTRTGSIYEGIFKNGYLQGQGRVKQPQGDQMVCQFQKGQVVTVIRLCATQTGQSKTQTQSLRVTA